MDLLVITAGAPPFASDAPAVTVGHQHPSRLPPRTTDQQFRDKLRKVDPPQRVRAFLDHHLEHYQQANGDPAPFLDHLKYVVLHPLEAVRAKSPQLAAAFDWFNKIMERLHKQHQLTKAMFLSRAFELALEKDDSLPTRVQDAREELATLMDIDAATARRIRDELAQDESVKRIGNYPMFLIKPEGRSAVERMHTEGGSTLPMIVQNHFNAVGGFHSPGGHEQPQRRTDRQRGRCDPGGPDLHRPA